jgi:cytochrome c553
MKKLSLALVLLTGLSAHALAGDPAAGEALTAVCAACHGADGNSPAAAFPKLAGQNEKYLIKQLIDIRNGDRPVPTMVGQLDNFSDGQIADIAAFYASNTQTPGRAADSDLELGAQVYRAGVRASGVAACNACHGARGSGNAPAGWPRLAGQHKDYIALQLRRWRTGAEYTLEENTEGRTNDGDARTMRDVALRMTDREIDAVANFIAGLH